SDNPRPSSAALRVLALAALAAAIALGACKRRSDQQQAASVGSAASPATAISDADRVEAKKTFETICFACHGMAGKGDGPGSAALVPPPRDLTDRTWQQSTTDEHIKQVITLG